MLTHGYMAAKGQDKGLCIVCMYCMYICMYIHTYTYLYTIVSRGSCLSVSRLSGLGFLAGNPQPVSNFLLHITECMAAQAHPPLGPFMPAENLSPYCKYDIHLQTSRHPFRESKPDFLYRTLKLGKSPISGHGHPNIFKKNDASCFLVGIRAEAKKTGSHFLFFFFFFF